MPQIFSRFVPLGNQRFVPLEDVIGEHLKRLFPGMEVLSVHTFRVTRNEDVEVEEDDAENLLKALEKELLRRRFGPPVRLEVEETIDDRVLELLISELGVSDDEVVRLPGPLDLRGLHDIADLDRGDLKYDTFLPATHRLLAPVESASPVDVFKAVARARTYCCTTPTTRSAPRSSASSSRPQPTRTSSRSSRPSTGPQVTPRSSTPSSTPPRPASRCW